MRKTTCDIPPPSYFTQLSNDVVVADHVRTVRCMSCKRLLDLDKHLKQEVPVIVRQGHNWLSRKSCHNGIDMVVVVVKFERLQELA